MKILIINDSGIENGGVSTYIKTLQDELNKKGHIVKILSSDIYYNKKHFNQFEFKGVAKQYTLIWYLNRLFNFDAYFNTKKIIKSFKPDIVHLNLIDFQTSPSVIFAIKKMPALMTLHDYCLLGPTSKIFSLSPYKSIKGDIFEMIKKFLYFKSIKKITLFISPSKHTEAYFVKKGIKNIQTIYNGVQLLNYSKIKPKSNLLYIGRLSKEKGVRYLLESIPLIINKIPQVHLQIVGDGPEKKELMMLVKEFKIDKYVSFINYVSNNNVYRFYDNSSIIIMPSIWEEPFGLVGIEAMSVGRPVIASNIGGIPEWLIDKETGYLIEPKNAKQISERIITLLSNKQLLERMGLNARKRAEKFTVSKHVNEMEKIYIKIQN